VNARNAVVMGLAAIAVTACGGEASTKGSAEIRVVFRYDDYSAISSTEFETRMFDLFAARGIGLTVSVIPFISAGDVHEPAPQRLLPVTREKLDALVRYQELGVIEIALHGFSHQTIRSHDYTEFEGLAPSEQSDRLSRGVSVLRAAGLEVRAFVPPWNRYDEHTLRALGSNGLEIISSDVFGTSESGDSLRFVPETGGLADLPRAVEMARPADGAPRLIVVVFHEFEFREVDQDGSLNLAWLDGWLERLDEDKRIAVGMLSAMSTPAFDHEAYRRATRTRGVGHRLAPAFLAGGFRLDYLYPAPADRFERLAVAWASVGLLYLLIGVLGAITARFVVRRLADRLALVLRVMAVVAFAGLVAYSLVDGDLYFRGASVLAVVAGGIVGAFTARRGA